MTSTATTSIPLHGAPTHEHGWIIESRHVTSDGLLLYVRCSECGVRRIDIQRSPHEAPQAISREAPDSARRPAAQSR